MIGIHRSSLAMIALIVLCVLAVLGLAGIAGGQRPTQGATAPAVSPTQGHVEVTCTKCGRPTHIDASESHEHAQHATEGACHDAHA